MTLVAYGLNAGLTLNVMGFKFAIICKFILYVS